MKIHLPQAQAAPEGRLPFDYTIDLSAEEINFQKPFQAPVRIHGHVVDSAGMIRLEGVIEARVSTNCARCNRPVVYTKAVTVAFMLATELEDEELDDIWVVAGDQVELDDVFVPELLMDMEMAVLCDSECRGLCPRCGHDLNLGDCGCDRREIDPRWAKLAEFTEKE